MPEPSLIPTGIEGVAGELLQHLFGIASSYWHHCGTSCCVTSFFGITAVLHYFLDQLCMLREIW